MFLITGFKFPFKSKAIVLRHLYFVGIYTCV